VLDPVQYVSDVFRGYSLTLEIVSKLWQVVNRVTDISPYEASQRTHAFPDTLSLGRFEGAWPQWREARSAIALEARLTTEASGTHSYHLRRQVLVI
jgi:uncharacterized protein with NRDE domain